MSFFMLTSFVIRYAYNIVKFWIFVNGLKDKSVTKSPFTNPIAPSKMWSPYVLRCSGSHGLFLYGFIGEITAVDSISEESECNHDAQDHHHVAYLLETSFHHVEMQSECEQSDRKENGDSHDSVHVNLICYSLCL